MFRSVLVVLLYVDVLHRHVFSSDVDDDDERPECQEFSSKTEPKRLRHAIMNHEPFRVPMRKITGQAAAGSHWDLFEDSDCFNLAVARDGIFFGAVSDGASPIGLRRVAPVLLECVPWNVLKDLITFYTERIEDSAYLAELLAELPVLRNASFANYNDALEEGEIPLPMAMKDENNVFFVNGQTSDAFERLLQKSHPSMLSNLTERLATAVNKEPLGARLWLSAGGVVERFHYDESSNWICQFAGTLEIDFASPAATDNMYPVNFADPVMNVDYQSILTSSGKLVEERVPVEFRQTDPLLIAVDEDEPDQFRYPKFVNVTTIACRVKPGQCVWAPSFWWRSTRSSSKTINMAISFDFGTKLPVNKTKFDVQAAQFGLESLARVTARELSLLSNHVEL